MKVLGEPGRVKIAGVDPSARDDIDIRKESRLAVAPAEQNLRPVGARPDEHEARGVDGTYGSGLFLFQAEAVRVSSV